MTSRFVDKVTALLKVVDVLDTVVPLKPRETSLN